MSSPNRLLPLLLALAALGCDPSTPNGPGGSGGDSSSPVGTQSGGGQVVRQMTTPEAHVTMLGQPDQQRRASARRALLALREKALPALYRYVDEKKAIASAQPIDVLVTLARTGIEREQITDKLIEWLTREVTPEAIQVYLAQRPGRPDPSLPEAERKKLEAERQAMKLKQQNTAIAFASLMSALIKLDAHDKIPVRHRVVYFSQVLAEHGYRDPRNSLSAREAAAGLLEIGPEALPRIAARANHGEDPVARQMFGVAFWMYRKEMVGALMAELEARPARNLQIYALLDFLTQHPVRLEDVGVERPTPAEFQKNRAKLLAEWHPKLFAARKAWWDANKQRSIEQWWAAAFSKAGVELPSLRSREAIPALIKVLGEGNQRLRKAALNLLQRLTYRQLHKLAYIEIDEYDYSDALKESFPDGIPADISPKQLAAALQADWERWWEQHKTKEQHELALIEAGKAKVVLKVLASQRKQMSPYEAARGFSAVFFLRNLLRDPETNTPGMPRLFWDRDLQSHRLRNRIITSHLDRLIALKFERADFRKACRGWWLN